jgi:hypothetical protein
MSEFNFVKGVLEGQEGMSLASGAPRAKVWNIKAERWLLEQPSGREVTSDDLTRECGLSGEGPNGANAVGTVQRQSRSKLAWTGRVARSKRVTDTGKVSLEDNMKGQPELSPQGKDRYDT